MKYIVSATKIPHVPTVCDKDVVPALWRAKRGWEFGRLASEWSGSLDVPCSQTCEGCFPQEQLEQRIEEISVALDEAGEPA